MSSISNFLKKTVLSTAGSLSNKVSGALNAKVSGALNIIDGSVGLIDDALSMLFGKFTTGADALTDIILTYEEEQIVSKDKTIASTTVDPLKAPITSNTSSPTFAEAVSSPAITSISPTQPNDISVTPTGTEPPMAFRGQYPYVHTHKSESGHIKEVDDTPGHERLLDYHRSGTYEEIAPDGRRVVKVVSDNHVVIVGDDNIYIEGSSNLYVRGRMSITCLNDVSINVGGRAEVNVTEDLRMKAKSISLESSSGDINIYSAKSLNTRSAANTSIYAEGNMNALAKDSMSVKSAKNLAMEAAEKASIKTKSEISMDSAVVLTNKGTSLPTAADASVSIAKKTGLGAGPTRENTTAPSILESIIQGVDDDEEEQAQAIQEAIASGRITQEEIDQLKNTTFETEETDSTPPGAVKPTATTANEIKSLPETAISSELKLSTNYRLSHLTAPGPVFDHQIRAQGGRTKAQIAGNLSLVAQNAIEPIAKKFGPITINSGFRQGSGKKSQHEKGMAVDITYGVRSTDPATMYAIAQWIKDNIAFDQLILEYGTSQIWTHVSFNGEGSQRGIVLTCPRAPTGGYKPGLQKVAWKKS